MKTLASAEPPPVTCPSRARLSQATVDPAAKMRRFIVIGILAVAYLGLPALVAAGLIEPYRLNLIGRYLCFAIAAVGIDLIWGYTGMLSLCQAFFFCAGAYAMAMHLSLPGGGGDVRPEYNNIPQFFFFNNVDTLPAFWQPFSSLPFSLAAAVFVPSAFAALFGFLIFRSRVRGVYFAVITQALAWAAFLSFNRNEMLLGGTNGLTNFYKPLNQNTWWVIGLYLLTLLVLTGVFLASRYIVRSRTGRVLIAIRDNESRLRFAGYNPALFKVFIFALAAGIAALGGVLYAPQNGIITPNSMRIEDSIIMIIWAAVGGRGRLWGAILGALVVNFSFSILTSDVPQAWPFLQGALFLGVVLFFPEGFAGVWEKIEQRIRDGLPYLALLIGFIGFLGAIMIQVLGFTPTELNEAFLGMPLKYWLLGGFVAVCAGVGRIQDRLASTPASEGGAA